MLINEEKMNNPDLVYEQSRSVTHEIRNHLSICEIYTQIIKKNLEQEGVELQSVDNALNCISKSIKIMYNSLLDLKSLNNFSMKEYDIKSLLEQGIKLAKVYIFDKNIKFNCDLNTTAKVYVDESKFVACIVNIIKNAIEAIDKNGEINISLKIKENNVHIKISNNGEPISAEKQQAIFKEGYTTKPTGFGLGLHICVNNLKAQNGILRLNKSTPEITEFEIILPVV